MVEKIKNPVSTSSKTGLKAVSKSRRARNLLLELGTEELPPKALKKLAISFATNIHHELKAAGVVQGSREEFRYFASPRRLAVCIKRVLPYQQDRVEQRRGPSVKAAFDQEGAPTKAAIGFAASCGTSVDKLETLTTDKGEWLVSQQKIPGASIQQLVNNALEQAVRKLPIPKRMRWGDSDVEFVRPVHWLLAMYGSDVLRVSVLGLQAEQWTYGHRFHAPKKLRILSADRYLKTLKTDGWVIADYEERKALIEKQVNRLAVRNDALAVIDDALLDEVTGLVEWPQALYGEFDKKFLKVPEKILISSMRDHQKYFHLVDGKNKLLPSFITVSNLKSSSPKRVRSGNERVLRARLADAEFFWHSDQKQPLSSRTDALAKVLFHEQLGSVLEKSQRMNILANTIADQIGVDREQVNRSVLLCKADLVTDMVGECPELQGLIGSYYAKNDGEDNATCIAIKEHYLPKFAGDDLPSTGLARCLALADRIDTLAGVFATGEIPTGDKDPYGLRRASLGVLRIMIEQNIDLDLRQLIAQAVEQLGLRENKALNTNEDTVDKVFAFVMERLKAYYQPLGYEPTEIASVAAIRTVRPTDFHRRLQAVHSFFAEKPDAARSLAAANKRIANILSKQKQGEFNQINEELLVEKAERKLAEQLLQLEEKVSAHAAKGDYRKSLQKLAKLKNFIDQFFDEVMVMDENIEIRNNRLALLNRLRHLFLGVADISSMRVD